MSAQLTRSGRRAARTRGKKWEIKVSLNVSGFAGSPSKITALLGIEPSRTWVAGDPVQNTTLKRQDNRWILDSPVDSAAPLSKHLESILSFASPAVGRFRMLPSGAKVQIFCAVYDYERAVVLEFTKDIITQLAAVGAGLGIDYYDMSEEA